MGVKDSASGQSGCPVVGFRTVPQGKEGVLWLDFVVGLWLEHKTFFSRIRAQRPAACLAASGGTKWVSCGTS